MSFYAIIENLIERKAILLLISILLCFSFLGSHDLWTQEHRWADIVSMMFSRHDFLHPYLGTVPYYDKPLLSYWFIAATVSVFQQFNSVTLRVPSALFGLLGLFSAYRIASVCYDKKSACLFVWLFLSCFFYVFWARTASADILNVAGMLFAISLYLTNRDKPTFLNLLSFFLVVALTSLCKGIVAAVLVFTVVGIDVLLRGTIKRYVSVSFLGASIIGAIVFCIPFMLSAYYPDVNFIAQKNSGLYLVYKENIVRFLKPFDHKEPFYVYFIYLPVYLFPWIVLFVPALFNRIKSFATLSVNSRWVLLSFMALFLFFTISGSRRSYYILPVVPFALLLILDWLQDFPRYLRFTKVLAVFTTVLLMLFFMVAQPLFYAKYGTSAFLDRVKEKAALHSPLQKGEVLLLGVRNKLAFYLELSPADVVNSDSQVASVINQLASQYRELHTINQLPVLILSRKEHVQLVQTALPGLYQETLSPEPVRFLGKVVSDSHEVIALIRKDHAHPQAK